MVQPPSSTKDCLYSCVNKTTKGTSSQPPVTTSQRRAPLSRLSTLPWLRRTLPRRELKTRRWSCSSSRTEPRPTLPGSWGKMRRPSRRKRTMRGSRKWRSRSRPKNMQKFKENTTLNQRTQAVPAPMAPVSQVIKRTTLPTQATPSTTVI